MADSLEQISAAAVEALRRRDGALACTLIEQLIAAGRASPETWLALSRARALCGDVAGTGEAIDRALSLNQRSLSSLVAKGDFLSETGDARGASAYYSAALRYMPEFAKLPPVQQQELQRAKLANEKQARDFEEHVRTSLGEQGVLGAQTPARFAQAVDILVGKRRPYLQSPRFFYFPELPQIQFYPREAFGWIEEFESAIADILSELKTAIEGRSFHPYLTSDASRPQGEQTSLTDSADWGAYFLIKDGGATSNAATCPMTMSALAKTPMPQIPSRTPHALFSMLAPNTKIPPHTGMLNVRLICHLALIIPPSCGLRVGNETRTWEQGKCWVFDDTIEHEAWNGSDQKRYVLIFDTWRPELSEEEREAVAALCAAVDSFGGPRQAWTA